MDIPVDKQEVRLQEIRQWPEAILVDRLFDHDDDPEMLGMCYVNLFKDTDADKITKRLSAISEIELVEPPADRYAVSG